MTPSSNATKLGARHGDVVRVAGLALAKARDLLDDDALALTLTARGRADVVVRFVGGLADATRGVSAIRGDAETISRVWLAYPKGSSRRAGDPNALHRDTLHRWLDEHDLRIATLVSLSETWTAARVRPR